MSAESKESINNGVLTCAGDLLYFFAISLSTGSSKISGSLSFNLLNRLRKKRLCFHNLSLLTQNVYSHVTRSVQLHAEEAQENNPKQLSGCPTVTAGLVLTRDCTKKQTHSASRSGDPNWLKAVTCTPFFWLNSTNFSFAKYGWHSIWNNSCIICYVAENEESWSISFTMKEEVDFVSDKENDCSGQYLEHGRFCFCVVYEVLKLFTVEIGYTNVFDQPFFHAFLKSLEGKNISFNNWKNASPAVIISFQVGSHTARRRL